MGHRVNPVGYKSIFMGYEIDLMDMDSIMRQVINLVTR